MELGLELKCKGEQILPVQTVKYLGIIVDEHLTFARQVESVCNKAHGKVATFRHGRRNITTAARRTFIFPSSNVLLIMPALPIFIASIQIHTTIFLLLAESA